MEKNNKPKKPKEKKPAPSELELLQKQADRMLRDMNRLQNTQSASGDQKKERSAVDIWKDTDFYFSVVFQSSAQKYQFLEQFSKKFGLGIDNIRNEDEVFSIVNGILLAKILGFKLDLEKAPAYVYPNLELKELSLDGEEF